MNSTGGLAGPRGSIRWPLTRRWVFAALSWLALAPALAQDNPMPRPPLLERDVQFWIRVYTQIDTNVGFLHDQYNLGVVYDTLHFAPNTTPAERERQVDQARERCGAALRRIADAADAPLAADDERIKELWGAEGTPARLRAAIEDIRFQLGQADRFRAGLIRSGAWETHIAETLANLGLPAELAVLPHVESSFNPAAYSKVGAAGLWQFMRSTGRRYMRIDGAVDDRLDPFRSTEAAVQLPAYVPMATLERALKIDAEKLRALNPALLHSVWDGQQRVPKAYRLRLPLEGSPWTRELLAQRLSPAEMFAGQSGPPRYRVQRGDTLTSVAGRYGVSADTLARLNHLRTGAQLHAGRTITVPETPPVPVAPAAPPAAAAPAPTAATSPAEPAAAAPAPTAATSPAAPAPAAPALTAATPRVALARPSPGGAVPAAVAQRESAEDAAVAAAAAKSRTAATSPQPVSAAQAEARSPALGPAAEGEQNPDPKGYSGAHDETIRAAGDE